MDNLYEQFFKILSEGSEEEIRNFLIENLDNFDEEVKREMVGLFFEEAVDLTYTMIEFKKKLLESAQNLERIKRLLENRKRELDLRKELGLDS